jgi:2'-5' RNA ligase
LGFDIENKAYSPHLTLGRVKKIKEEIKFKEIFITKTTYPGKIDVKEFQLFQSVLTKEGPQYSVLSRFKLRTINLLKYN